MRGYIGMRCYLILRHNWLPTPYDITYVSKRNLLNVIRYSNVQVEFSRCPATVNDSFSNNDNDATSLATLRDTAYCKRTTDQATIDAYSRRMS